MFNLWTSEKMKAPGPAWFPCRPWAPVGRPWAPAGSGGSHRLPRLMRRWAAEGWKKWPPDRGAHLEVVILLEKTGDPF